MVLRAVLFLLPLALVSGAGKQRVWELDLNAHIQEAVPVQHFVESVAFSDADRLVAVLLSREASLSPVASYLMIVDVQDPEKNVQLFDVPGSCWSDLAWNPEGDAVLACGKVVQIRGGTSCGIGGKRNTFWLDGRHVVRDDGKIFDMLCNEAG
jgi:hypothetical protein